MAKLNDLIFQVKRNLSFSELLPLTKVLTKEDKENFKKKGYHLGLTLSEFKERFKNINPENIYFGNTLATNGAIYIDRDKFICVEISLLGDTVLRVFEEESDEEVLLKPINITNNFYNEKKYNKLLFMCPSALKFELLRDILNANLLENPYNLFIETYAQMEYGFDRISIDLLENVLNKRTDKEIQDFKERIKDLPEEVIVYRGEGDIRRDFNTCYSWTLDINIANFFATRYSDEKSRIIKAVISKKDILDYISIMGESEILLNPKDIKNIEVFDLPSMMDLDRNTFNFTCLYVNMYNFLIEYLYSNNDNRDHDKTHTKRVLFLSAILCDMIGVNEDLLDKLFTAIAFHDTGRINDEIDGCHGERAVPIYRKEVKNNSKITEFLIKYHCLDDKLGIKYIEENFKEEDIDNIKLLYSIIKDADALDRVRFGIKALDINYLRNEESKKLLFIAKQLLECKL